MEFSFINVQLLSFEFLQVLSLPVHNIQNLAFSVTLLR
jgi:hypothetical protein